ncbi:MAG: hypothetical protein BWZ02_02963 [Lentisphaerae bacterium ADurb.BinA184]|nr:MAG: hypothetical protein BWZ02_02963 [Lentisphaerae bacterium ADurb.BinA184]
MHLISVVLPAPLGPMIETYSPASTANETPLSTGRAPKLKWKSRTSMIGSAIVTPIPPRDAAPEPVVRGSG